ncbi:MAG: hypothetical protein JG718_09950 [Candidatus Thiothrix moscowensis]|nr:hypothetical protein [Candidatus Thiothrix moscowensis]
MNDEVKPLFPAEAVTMSTSYHPPSVVVQPYGMAISLLFDDFSIELNNKNGLSSAYKLTTYSFIADNPLQDVVITIKYSLDKTSESAKAFVAFLSDIDCFTQEVVALAEKNGMDVNVMSSYGEINVLVPASSRKRYSFALSIFASRTKDDELIMSIDRVDIERSFKSAN